MISQNSPPCLAEMVQVTPINLISILFNKFQVKKLAKNFKVNINKFLT